MPSETNGSGTGSAKAVQIYDQHVVIEDGKTLSGGAIVQLHQPHDRLDRFTDIRGAMRRAYLAFDGGHLDKNELATRVGALERMVKAKTAETNAEALARLAEAPFMGLILVGPGQQQE